MLALETKQSGGKLLPHSDLRVGGGFPGEESSSRQRGMKTGTWNLAANQLASQEGLCTME